LPEDEEQWGALNIVFSTLKGNIRRNSLSDFKRIQSNGKIAMKLSEGDSLIGVRVCEPEDHIMIAAQKGNSVRFPVSAVRVFKGRDSDGVRGIRLPEGDRVLSMSILRSVIDHTTEERDEYLKISLQNRSLIAALEDGVELDKVLSTIDKKVLTNEKIVEMAKREQFILTITENGYGKRTSAYEYRVTNRGGTGVVNIITSSRNGNVVSSMIIKDDDQIIMMTDRGTVIRCPVHDIRVTSRNTQGVVLFKTKKGEVVVSSARIKSEALGDSENGNEEDEPQDGSDE
jgi:DNA gyrase subunit A